MPFVGRELIADIGGDMRPGEGRKGYLRRVAQVVEALAPPGIGMSSMEKSWKRQYESKATITKLEQAKQAKQAADNDKELAFLSQRLEKLAASMEGRDRQTVEQIRTLALRLRHLDSRAGPPAGRKE